ncbi:MAG: [FeFe] hydrogenase H-cluster radical SAM maturase HydG [Lentisphaeria bacterium]|nr:[FeFe] hydrogenase H-cluster radical SAM maturase HydG [Lentisphaeria bacterium]
MTINAKQSPSDYVKSIIKDDQIRRYMDGDKDFIDDDKIHQELIDRVDPDPSRVRDILAKSLEIETLDLAETATLLHVTDPDLRAEMEAAASEVKHKVYDNRIVTFAPLYMSNLCVNNCMYCGFRDGNTEEIRSKLSMDTVRAETEVLAGKIGHKRLIVVYGEHPSTSTDYIAETIQTVYGVDVPTRRGTGAIRRVNVNAAPLPIEDLSVLRDVGIGTYQVFQETYDRAMYKKAHPGTTVKSHYRWRLYCMHRALEAGVDDVGMGALFGLADWKFEVMALVAHARELENKFNIGPHTISFPRLEPACNAPLTDRPEHEVTDDDFRRLVTVLRLAVPYPGMIITAREDRAMRDAIIPLGCTQTDASTKIGLGAYSESSGVQATERQQFMIGDTRSLEELICDLARQGIITSFCTAGYRCGRTGGCIMDMLKTGKEGHFCKVNAVLTFREWLDDFASPEALEICRPVIDAELAQIKANFAAPFYDAFMDHYHRIEKGERDLYF